MAGHQSVAVVFHRLGPYHHARLCAASKKHKVIAIQGCRHDTIYQWDKIDHQGEYPLETLFDSGDCEDKTFVVLRRNVAETLNRLDPAVVMIPGWGSKLALSCLAWCLEAGKPAVVGSDSTAWDSARHPVKEWIKGRLVHLFSAALVAGLPHRDYIVSLGMRPDQVVFGYDVVDNRYFEDKTAEIRIQKLEFRRKYALPDSYFLASARFVEKKNLPRLIEAYASYRKAVNASQAGSDKPAAPWSLVLLGDGPQRPSLNSLLSERNLQDHVLLPGFKQYAELPVYYGLASAFIHASTTEQWGLVVNEAMASRLPVLVSNRCGCAGDLVEEGVNGFTFDPCNVEELASRMLELSAAKSPLTAFGASSNRIISAWGLERFANGLQEAVEKAIVRGPVKPTWLQRGILNSLMAR